MAKPRIPMYIFMLGSLSSVSGQNFHPEFGIRERTNTEGNEHVTLSLQTFNDKNILVLCITRY